MGRQCTFSSRLLVRVIADNIIRLWARALVLRAFLAPQPDACRSDSTLASARTRCFNRSTFCHCWPVVAYAISTVDNRLCNSIRPTRISSPDICNGAKRTMTHSVARATVIPSFAKTDQKKNTSLKINKGRDRTDRALTACRPATGGKPIFLLPLYIGCVQQLKLGTTATSLCCSCSNSRVLFQDKLHQETVSIILSVCRYPIGSIPRARWAHSFK